jgi:transcriptional regulator with XRE-family HTH domain
MAIGPEKGFDGEAFYESLVSTVTARQVTWKQVSTETGVSATTLTRMAQGRRPDAASLAALGAWAGLNPAEFVTQQDSPRFAEPLAQISHLLRSDRRLNRDAAEAIDAMLRSAYERLRAQSALHGDQLTAESLGTQRSTKD